MSNQPKTKRTRVKLSFTENVDFKIKQLQKVLNVDKFESKWDAICNDYKKMQLNLVVSN